MKFIIGLWAIILLPIILLFKLCIDCTRDFYKFICEIGDIVNRKNK